MFTVQCSTSRCPIFDNNLKSWVEPFKRRARTRIRAWAPIEPDPFSKCQAPWSPKRPKSGLASNPSLCHCLLNLKFRVLTTNSCSIYGLDLQRYNVDYQKNLIVGKKSFEALKVFEDQSLSSTFQIQEVLDEMTQRNANISSTIILLFLKHEPVLLEFF